MDVKKELEDIVEKIPDSYLQNIRQRDDVVDWINARQWKKFTGVWTNLLQELFSRKIDWELFADVVVEKCRDRRIKSIKNMGVDSMADSGFPETITECQDIINKINELKKYQNYSGIGGSFIESIVNPLLSQFDITPTTLVYSLPTSKTSQYTNVARRYFSDSTINSILDSSSTKIPVDLFEKILEQCKQKKQEIEERDEKIRKTLKEREIVKNRENVINYLEENGFVGNTTDLETPKLEDIVHKIKKLLIIGFTSEEEKLIFEKDGKTLVPKSEDEFDEIITKIEDRQTDDRVQSSLQASTQTRLNREEEERDPMNTRRQDYSY